MKKTLGLFSRFRGWALVASLIALTGCEMGPLMFLGARDREIAAATEAIQTARNDADRAQAYSKRGAAYSEKARYSRTFKLVPANEYERLFKLSLKDHDQAIALNPESAAAYFNRAQANYDRGTWDLVGQDSIDPKDGKPWLDLAAADFTKAAGMNPKDELTLDLLGLTHEQNGESAKAIADYTNEMALNPRLAKMRLADAYCDWGFRLGQQKDYAAAAVKFQKSIEFGDADEHSCRADPYGALIAFHTSETQYDKAWDILHQARKSRRWIQPELVDKLKKESGRSD